MERVKEPLKRCPHCGGKAYLNANYNYRQRVYFVFVKCDICGAQGKAYCSDTDPAADGWNSQSCADAASAWNMRYREEQRENGR